MPRLSGQTTIITGGASGMGRATTTLFLREGANVIVGDLNEENGDGLRREMAELGFGPDRLEVLRTDVSQEADVRALVDRAVSRFGRLDVMFNNAGIEGAFGPVWEIDVDHWDKTFAINARGVFLGIKHASRIMKDQGGGSIINTASLAGLTSGAGALVYSASKAAVVRLSQAAALELAKYNIRVNAICPGMIFTPMMHKGNVEQADALRSQLQPLPVRGTAEHIAQAALFFASAESAFVSGDAMVVDGALGASGPLGHHPMSHPGPHRAGMAYGTTGIARESRAIGG